MAEAGSSIPWLWIGIGATAAVVGIGAVMMLNSEPCRGDFSIEDEYSNELNGSFLAYNGLTIEGECSAVTIDFTGTDGDGKSWKVGADNTCTDNVLPVTTSTSDEDGVTTF